MFYDSKSCVCIWQIYGQVFFNWFISESKSVSLSIWKDLRKAIKLNNFSICVLKYLMYVCNAECVYVINTHIQFWHIFGKTCQIQSVQAPSPKECHKWQRSTKKKRKNWIVKWKRCHECLWLSASNKKTQSVNAKDIKSVQRGNEALWFLSVSVCVFGVICFQSSGGNSRAVQSTQSSLVLDITEINLCHSILSINTN